MYIVGDWESIVAAAHGKTDVERVGNIIFTWFYGSFNAEGVIEYSRKVKACIDELGDAPFAMIVDDSAIEGGTPGAYEELNKYNEWMNSQNIVAKAFVVKTGMVKHIIVQRTPALKAQNTNFFESQEDALLWVKAQLQRVSGLSDG